MFTAQSLLEVLALPGGIALVVGAIAFWLKSHQSTAWWARLRGVTIVPLAYIVAHFVHFPQRDWGNWQAVDAWQWILPGAALAMIVGVLDAIVGRVWLKILLRIILLAAFAAITLNPMIRHTWTTSQSAIWIAGVALVGAAWWELAERAGRKPVANWVAAQWLLLAIGCGAIFVLSYSQRLLEMCMILGSALGICVVIQIAGARAVAAGLLAVAPFILIGLWLNAHIYADMPWWRAAIPAVAIFGGVIGRHIPRSGAKPWVGGLVGLLLVALVLAAAIIPTAMQYEPDPYSGY